MKKTVIAILCTMGLASAFAQAQQDNLSAPHDTICMLNKTDLKECIIVSEKVAPIQAKRNVPVRFVYKSKNSDGKWVYSDQETSGAQKLDLQSEEMKERITIIHQK